MNLQSTLLEPNASLKDAIALLEATEEGIVLVVTDNNILLGTITDGDIRRSLLAGLNLDVQIKEVMKADMIVLNEKEENLYNKALHLMNKNNIRRIPVLDEIGRVVNLITDEDFNEFSQKKNPMVVIMAGGLGSRLKPLTEKTPKPMLKLGQKPMLEMVLDNCIRVGLKNFYFAVNHLKDQIIEYFGDGSKW